MSLRAVIVVVAMGGLLASLGCGTARRGEPITGSAIPSQFSRGEQVFSEHCHKCHTGGEGALGPGINDKPLPKFLMRFQVRHGLGTMPAFTEQQISDEELDHLVDYLQALRARKSAR